MITANPHIILGIPEIEAGLTILTIVVGTINDKYPIESHISALRLGGLFICSRAVIKTLIPTKSQP
jgi:hypothetical protein